jgi:hypothetical protein
MPDFPVISGVADLPKFYFPQGAPFRLTLSIGAEFSMTGKFVAFGMRARSGTIRRIFGTDSGESNLTVAGQVITLNIPTDAATVPAFASGWTLEDVQAHLQTEYWVDISATEGSDILLRLQGQLDWVEPGSDIAESSAIVESPSIDVAINSGAISASISVLGAAEPTLTTNTVTSGLTGILKAASNSLDVAVAGTDYIAPNTAATLTNLTVTSVRGASGAKAQLQFPDFTTYGTNRFIGTGNGATGFNLTELYDGSANRIGYVYCDAAGGMSFANERAGGLKFLSNSLDRLTIYSGGGAYLGNTPSDPGAFNLKVQGTVEAGDGLIYTPTIPANWTSGADPGMVKDALDQLASRTKTLETTGGGGGTNGWSPVLAVVSDGERRVLQVADWQGGTGTKPATGLYVGTAGLVALIANAVDVRGAAGAAGATGATGAAGPNTVTTSTTTNITGLLKGNGTTVAQATAGTDYVATNDLRLHDRSHAITSTSDHTAGNWKVFHSNASGQIVELPLGADGTFLKSNGASLAPSFATPTGGGSSITGTGFAYVRAGGNDSTGTIGNPSLPYLTAQAAWDDGAKSFDIGAGGFSIDAAFGGGQSPIAIYVCGTGSAGSSPSTLFLTWRGEDGVDQNGFTAPELTLTSNKSVALNVTIEGGDGTSSLSDVFTGGNVADYNFRNCYISTLTLTPGAGCNGGAGGTDATTANLEFTTIVSGTPVASTVTRNGVLQGSVFYPDKLSDGDKGSITVSSSGTAWSVNTNVLQLNNLTTASAKGKLIGRKTAGAGNFEECAITDFSHVTEHYMRTTDFTDSTGTVSDVTGLSCSVAVNEKLLIEIVGFRAGGAAGSGLKISFSGPDSPTDVKYTLEHWNAVSTGRTVAAATSFNTVLTQADGNTDYLPLRVTLTLINATNSGTVQLRAGSEGSGTSITLPRGLTMRVHRIP